MKRIFLLLPFLLAAAAPAQDTNYVLRSDLAAYATVSDLASLVTHASLSNYTLTSDLSAYLPRSDLAGYVTAADLTNYATLGDLAAYAPLSALDGYVTATNLAGYALLSDLSAYATSSDLADYATTADLTNYPTASDLAVTTAAITALQARTNVFTEAWYDSDLGKWFVDEDIDIDADATLNGHTYIHDLEIGNHGITLGNTTRTNWNDVQSLTLLDDESGSPTANDGFVWTFPEENNCHVYLPDGPAATNRTRTVVVRHIESGIGGTATVVYDGPASTNVLHSLTSTNPTAVFDWCPSAGAWLLR